MKLEMDLVRKILLWMENDPTITTTNEDEVALGSEFKTKPIEKRIKFDGYGCNFLEGNEIDGETQEKVQYHFRKMIEAGLVNGEDLGGQFNILEISFAGHQLLEKIRDDEIWRRTKEGANRIGSFSIETIKEIATAVAKKKFKDLTGMEL